ncbi:MAG: hypothetical protein JNK90_14805 [Planctomycetaceae bacterium]|nr:hypothetical protein [Planctomycetaceae bacterium]
MIRHILRYSSDLIALADMRANFIAVAVLLVLGVIVLRSVSPVANTSAVNTSAPRWWLVVTAFVSGPASALAWFAADVLWISPGDYLVANDYAEPQIPIMIIGIIGGTIGAIAIWGSECMTCCSMRMRSRITTNVADEQSHAQEPAAEPVSNGEFSPPAR